MPGDQLILQSLPKWSYPTFPTAVPNELFDTESKDDRAQA